MKNNTKCKFCPQPLVSHCDGCCLDYQATKSGELHEPLPTKFCGKSGNAVKSIIEREKRKAYKGVEE